MTPDPPAPAPGSPSPVVVLIEDEPQIRRFLRATLGSNGYRLYEATSGEDGLVEAATRQPDVVILDLGLPDVDGLQVIRRLRESSLRGARFSCSRPVSPQLFLLGRTRKRRWHGLARSTIS